MWRLTRVTYMRSMMSGWLHRDLVDMHTQYGDIVRIAPDELSFTNPVAWDDIYTHKNGTPPFAKFKVWFSPRKDRAMSLLTALDPKDHARIHRALAPGFSEAAVLRQEPIIRGYVDTLISKLSDLSSKKSTDTVVDIVTWYNYIMFDIIGDLGFGESFHVRSSSQVNGTARLKSKSASKETNTIPGWPSSSTPSDLRRYLLLCVSIRPWPGS